MTILEAIRERDAREGITNETRIGKDRRWLLARVAQLEKAARDLKDDLLLRGQRDADGIIVVNASARIWDNLNDALAALAEKEPTPMTTDPQRANGHPLDCQCTRCWEYDQGSGPEEPTP